jgi:hypothetical protein
MPRKPAAEYKRVTLEPLFRTCIASLERRHGG